MHLVSIWAYAAESSLKGNAADNCKQEARQFASRALALTIEILEPIKNDIEFKEQLEGQQWQAVRQLTDPKDWAHIEQVAVR